MFAVDTVTLHNFTLALQFLLQIADQGSSVARRLIFVPEALNNLTEMSRLEKLIVSQLIKHIYIFYYSVLKSTSWNTLLTDYCCHNSPSIFRIHFNNIHTSCLLPSIHPNKILRFMAVSSSIRRFILIISTHLVSSLPFIRIKSYVLWLSPRLF